MQLEEEQSRALDLQHRVRDAAALEQRLLSELHSLRGQLRCSCILASQRIGAALELRRNLRL